MILQIPNSRLWLGNSPSIPMALWQSEFPNGPGFLWSVAEDETTPPLRTCTSGSIFFEALGFNSNTNLPKASFPPMLPPYIQRFERCLSMSKNCPSCDSLQWLRHQMVKGFLHRHNFR